MLKIFENWKKLKWKLGKSQFSKVENWKNLIWPLGTGAETAKHDLEYISFYQYQKNHTSKDNLVMPYSRTSLKNNESIFSFQFSISEIKIDLFKKWKRKHTVLLDVKATFNLMRNWNRFSA